MKRYKKFMFSEKCFSSIEKKAGIVVNEAFEKRGKSAKLKKCQQFKQIQKLEIAIKNVWKQALENEKKVVKNKKQMLRKEKTSDFDNRF